MQRPCTTVSRGAHRRQLPLYDQKTLRYHQCVTCQCPQTETVKRSNHFQVRKKIKSQPVASTWSRKK